MHTRQHFVPEHIACSRRCSPLARAIHAVCTAAAIQVSVCFFASMKELPPILTVEELAALLHLSAHGVRAALRRRALPASRIGRRWFVRRDALERHLLRAEQSRSAEPNSTNDLVERAIRGLPGRRRRSGPSERAAG